MKFSVDEVFFSIFFLLSPLLLRRVSSRTTFIMFYYFIKLIVWLSKRNFVQQHYQNITTPTCYVFLSWKRKSEANFFFPADHVICHRHHIESRTVPPLFSFNFNKLVAAVIEKNKHMQALNCKFCGQLWSYEYSHFI